jgi:hypothetical protein
MISPTRWSAKTPGKQPGEDPQGHARPWQDVSLMPCTPLVKLTHLAEWEDELSLLKGSCITVMEKCSYGWWCCSFDGWILCFLQLLAGGGGQGGH